MRAIIFGGDERPKMRRNGFMSDSEQITIYQLKIFILGISRMSWRQVKVHSKSTITDLDYINTTIAIADLRLFPRPLILSKW